MPSIKSAFVGLAAKASVGCSATLVPPCARSASLVSCHLVVELGGGGSARPAPRLEPRLVGSGLHPGEDLTDRSSRRRVQICASRLCICCLNQRSNSVWEAATCLN